MAIFINENRKVKNIFVNVNGGKKSISSAWMNKDGIPTKVFQINNIEEDSYEISPENEYNDWIYTLDEENNIITLQQYIGTTQPNVKVYTNYVISNKKYKTQLAKSCKNMFSTNKSIETVKFGNDIYADVVSDMSSMFDSCTLLKSVDMSHINWKNNVINFSKMFHFCTSLKDINLGDFNVYGIYTDYMFYQCALNNLDLGKLNIKFATKLDYMFAMCAGLTKIYVDGNGWSISNSASKTNMFYRCGTSSVTYK